MPNNEMERTKPTLATRTAVFAAHLGRSPNAEAFLDVP
jgi:hypothetical protein